jgi:hypothetical protein
VEQLLGAVEDRLEVALGDRLARMGVDLTPHMTEG